MPTEAGSHKVCIGQRKAVGCGGACGHITAQALPQGIKPGFVSTLSPPTKLILELPACPTEGKLYKWMNWGARVI